MKNSHNPTIWGNHGQHLFLLIFSVWILACNLSIGLINTDLLHLWWQVEVDVSCFLAWSGTNMLQWGRGTVGTRAKVIPWWPFRAPMCSACSLLGSYSGASCDYVVCSVHGSLHSQHVSRWYHASAWQTPVWAAKDKVLPYDSVLRESWL